MSKNMEKTMRKSLISGFALAAAMALSPYAINAANAAPKKNQAVVPAPQASPVATCDVQNLTTGETTPLTVPVDGKVYFEGGPRQAAVVNGRTVILMSNRSRVSLAIFDGVSTQQGSAFWGTYKDLSGEKDKGGFTGELQFLQPRDKAISISCHMAPAIPAP